MPARAARRERRPLAVVIADREHLGVVPAVRADVDRRARAEVDLAPHVAVLVGLAGVREPALALDALPAAVLEALERVVARAVEIEVEPEVRVIRVLVVDAGAVDRQPRAQPAVVVEPPQLRVLVRPGLEARRQLDAAAERLHAHRALRACACRAAPTTGRGPRSASSSTSSVSRW